MINTKMKHKLEQQNILEEVIELISKKHNDYQNPNSRIKQSDYYPSGLISIIDLINMKMLRTRSLIESYSNNEAVELIHTKIEDSLKDMIAYAAIAAAYSRGKVDGQSAAKDFLNRNVNA